MSATIQLLVTLVGVTFLFGCVQANGTLERVVSAALQICHGRTRLLLPMIFVLAAATSAVGPGGILATAMIAPFAMSAGLRIGQTPFLISVMVCHGALAGFLSPFSTSGAVVAALLGTAELSGQQYRMWMFQGLAHVAMATTAYVFWGGFRTGGVAAPVSPTSVAPLTLPHVTTLVATAAWIVATAIFKLPLGWSALAAGVGLCLVRVASPRAAVEGMPWKMIALVTAISSAVSVVDRAGGLEWFKEALASIATPDTIHAAIAFAGGLISAYSSTTAVVLPAFLPMVPAIADRFAGVDPLALATSLLIGATLVDCSPLSTSGALCVAAAPPGPASAVLFRRLLLWGFAMAVVAGAICHVASPAFAP